MRKPTLSGFMLFLAFSAIVALIGYLIGALPGRGPDDGDRFEVIYHKPTGDRRY